MSAMDRSFGLVGLNRRGIAANVVNMGLEHFFKRQLHTINVVSQRCWGKRYFLWHAHANIVGLRWIHTDKIILPRNTFVTSLPDEQGCSNMLIKSSTSSQNSLLSNRTHVVGLWKTKGDRYTRKRHLARVYPNNRSCAFYLWG